MRDYKRIIQQASNVVDDGYKINVLTSAGFKVFSQRLTYASKSVIAHRLLPIAYCLLFIFSSCSPTQEKLYKESRSSMYTIVSITVSSESEEKAKTAIDRAFNELDRLAKLLNFYSDDSEISAINRYAGDKPVKASSETLEIIDKALYVSEKTEGAFDITVGPVVRLWDFQNKVLPDEKLIKEKLKLVGYKNIIVNKEKSTVFLKTKGVQIDLGGIIKGYAADKAVGVMKKLGINSGIVAVAGDIKTFGIRPDGGLWKVGIQNPRPNPPSPYPSPTRGEGTAILPPPLMGGGKGEGEKGFSDEIMATVGLSDMAISTSGDYQKFFIKDGKKYHHLLNPKTGYPANECQSVTVITKDAAFTDAFATGICILGTQKGMDTLNRLGLDGVIVAKDGKMHVTEGLKDKITIIGDRP